MQHCFRLPSFLRMHSWHTMIQKVYEIDPLLCPFCGGEVKILSFIIKPKTIKKILDGPAFTKARATRSFASPFQGHDLRAPLKR